VSSQCGVQTAELHRIDHRCFPGSRKHVEDGADMAIRDTFHPPILLLGVLESSEEIGHDDESPRPCSFTISMKRGSARETKVKSRRQVHSESSSPSSTEPGIDYRAVRPVFSYSAALSLSHLDLRLFAVHL